MHDNDLADLELTPDQMQTLGDCVLRRVVEHLSSIAEQPVRGAVNTPAECRALREPAPERGTALEQLVDRLFDEWIPRPEWRSISIGTRRPGRERDQSLHRGLAGRAGARTARGQCARLVSRLDAVPGDDARRVHDRRVGGEFRRRRLRS
jgi:hypothetical protein